MKKYALCVLVLLALPALATISNVQSNAKWTCSGSGSSITCFVTLTTQPTTTGNLIVVWTFWQSSSTYTASVSDNTTPPNTFYSAVGPTLQSAASTPTSAQIFYAKKIQGSGTGNDTVTVTFTSSAMSPTISSAGVVVVEYSGADQSYPLDSTSAGYSYSASGLLDSGTAVPANANLLVFGGGKWDGGSLVAGGGFTAIQASGGGITEQMIVSGNNTLQRATAIPNPTGNPPSSTGNWLMQMAVFRDASWTVTGAWSPIRVGSTRYPEQFPGATADVQIANAMADLPAAGGVVDATGYGCTSQTLAAQLVIGTPTKMVKFRYNPCTVFHFHYTGSNTTDGVVVDNGSDIEAAGVNFGRNLTFNSASWVVDSSTGLRCEFGPAHRDGSQQGMSIVGVTTGAVNGTLAGVFSVSKVSAR